MSNNVKLRIGQGLINVLLCAARGELFYRNDPREAMKTIRDTLTGCTHPQVLDILFGRAEPIYSAHSLTLVPVEHGDTGVFYQWAQRSTREVQDLAAELIDAVYLVSERIKERGGDVERVQVSFKEIARSSTLRDACWGQQGVSLIAWLVDYAPEFLNDAVSLVGALKFCETQLRGIKGIDDVENLVKRLQIDFRNFCLTDYTPNECVSNAKTLLLIDAALQCMEPVNIEDGYDACWIAPDGTTYGINGPKWAPLHLDLSERILEMGYVRDGRTYPHPAPDAYLEQLGFVKLYRGHVLFAGSAVDWEEPTGITPQQIGALVRYGKLYYDGRLYCGHSQRNISVGALLGMGKHALRELFNN